MVYKTHGPLFFFSFFCGVLSGRSGVPFAALAALQVVEAGLTGAAVAVDDVRETLALACDLQTRCLLIHCAVWGTGAGCQEEKQTGHQWPFPFQCNISVYVAWLS